MQRERHANDRHRERRQIATTKPRAGQERPEVIVRDQQTIRCEEPVARGRQSNGGEGRVCNEGKVGIAYVDLTALGQRTMEPKFRADGA